MGWAAKETPGQRCGEGGMRGLLGSVTAHRLRCPQTWPIFKDSKVSWRDQRGCCCHGRAPEEGGALGCRSAAWPEPSVHWGGGGRL